MSEHTLPASGDTLSPPGYPGERDLPAPPEIAAPEAPRPPARLWLHAVLFALTLLTTTAVGVDHWAGFQANFGPVTADFGSISFWLNGLWYSLTILAILGAHESGHYLACRYHGVDASLPYFLPVPLPLTGTAGAFIRIRTPIALKRVLFDVGVAGPIAGFLVALPALIVGLRLSRVVEVPAGADGLVELGEPLLLQGVAHLLWGDLPAHLTINMHPVAFAAWFGMLATAINLFPIGQFDGGHIAYAVFGRRASVITVAAVLGAIGLSIYSTSWILWTAIAVFLLYKFGWRHPATWDEDIPLDRVRLWVAFAALLIFVACFTPAPISPLELVGAP